MKFSEIDDILNQMKDNNELDVSDELEKPVKSRRERAAEEEKKFWEEQSRLESERQAKLEAERKAKQESERQARLDEIFRQRAAERMDVSEENLKIEDDAVLPEPVEDKDISFVLEEFADTEKANDKADEDMEFVRLDNIEPSETSEPSDDEDDELVWFDASNEAEKEQKSTKEMLTTAVDKIKSFKPKDAVDKIKNIDIKEIKAKTVSSLKNAGEDFAENKLPKIKAWAKRVFTKQVIIAIVAVIALVGAVVGGIKLYQYSKVAYLKPYQEKYKIEYPVGILEEMCDAYGKNQHVVGRVQISDTKLDKYATYQITRNYVFSHTGTDVNENQQFRAIDLTGYCDLEGLYASRKSFLNASQIIKFDTLFEENEYKVVAAYYTNKYAYDDNDYVFPYNVYGTMTEKSFKAYADRIKSRSLYYTGYDLNMEDEFLSVSVNSDFMDNFKFVVVCVKTDKRHFEKSTKATVNKKIHYPQVWYDKNNKENTFRFASKWYPEIYTNDEKTKTKKLTADDFDFD